MNNVTLDINNNIKIPQNDNTFFIIQKYAKGEYSILIKFNFSDSIHYLNLFFIIKSFILNTDFPPYSLCSLVKKNNQEIITQKDNILYFKNLDFYSFKDGIDYRIQKDSKYNETDTFYGIVLVYSKTLSHLKNKNIKEKYPDLDLFDILKPKYPGTPEWLNLFKTQLDTITLLQEKINFLEKKNKQ